MVWFCFGRGAGAEMETNWEALAGETPAVYSAEGYEDEQC